MSNLIDSMFFSQEFDVKSIVDNWVNEDKLKDAIAKKEAAEKKAKESNKVIEAAKTEANNAIGLQ